MGLRCSGRELGFGGASRRLDDGGMDIADDGASVLKDGLDGR